MSVDVEIPNPFGLNVGVSGGLDLDLDEIRIKELAPINVNADLSVSQLPVIELNADLSVSNIPTIELDTKSQLSTDSTLSTDSKVNLQSDSKLDLGLDNIRIRELPRLDFQFGLRPARFHLPLNYHFSLSLFGKKVLGFNLCGQGMLAYEDYKKRQTECCD